MTRRHRDEGAIAETASLIEAHRFDPAHALTAYFDGADYRVFAEGNGCLPPSADYARRLEAAGFLGSSTAWMFRGPRTPSDRIRHLRSVYCG